MAYISIGEGAKRQWWRIQEHSSEEFLDEEGIKHEFSAPYDPPQNGIVERKNQTLIEAARAMLDEYKTSDVFWAKAVSTACHAINRFYLHKILKKTSYELLSGKKPNVSYFRVFGSKCFILSKRSRSSKFSPKVDEGFLLGYESNAYAYRVFNKTSGIVEVTRDVTFDESNGSQGEQVVVHVVGDVDPSQAIGPEVPGYPVRNLRTSDSEDVPTAVEDALGDPDWEMAMQEELNNFTRNQVWTSWAPSRFFATRKKNMGWLLFQMDVKSAFLNGPISELVYVEQPPGFEDPKLPNHVYKLHKALYGLKQAPRAWFEMSMMGELTFFLGLQVKQAQEGIFISQTKYVKDILKKFGMEDAKPIKTPIPTNGHLDLDDNGKSVDQKVYRSMIGSLLYLCASRPDIMLSVCMCAHFQAEPKECHLIAVKRILRYLVHTPNLGLWYPKDCDFELFGYSDSDYAGCKVDRKSTIGTCQFLPLFLGPLRSKIPLPYPPPKPNMLPLVLVVPNSFG
uniref:OSJNBa0019K04.23 protein n=1 Tax=Oryza sativa subsp. japonica TaxID=39947 RepID=Q7XTX5_ORYSJ|nr:OSJNBa0019K04.23 [Oryza sativa Japonica Group]